MENMSIVTPDLSAQKSNQEEPAAPDPWYHVLSAIERARMLSDIGEKDLAAIELIQLLALLPKEMADLDANAALVRAEVLNDLAVMRFREKDLDGALGCLKACLEVCPNHPLAPANLADVTLRKENAGPRVRHLETINTSVDNLNHWVEQALNTAARTVGLEGKEVLEIGGTIPVKAVRGKGVKRWVACDLRAEDQKFGDDYETRNVNVVALPFEDNSFDVIFSCAAFEHITGLDKALLEMRRVLRPGGHLFTQYSPIWSGPQGHHLVLFKDPEDPISFNDPVLPPWSHLLLTEPEMENFLKITVGPGPARRAAHFIYHTPVLNRLFQADFKKLFDDCGLTITTWEALGTPFKLGDKLREVLSHYHPGGGDFEWPGIYIILRKDV